MQRETLHTAPNFEAVALEWLVQHIGYPRKGLETELAALLKKVHDEATSSERNREPGGKL